MKLSLDITKSVENNAQTYFEKAKKAKKKLDGARKALERSIKKFDKEQVRSDKEISKLREAAKVKEKRKKKWFEKFRWFVSSNGFLVIGGRDATTNEIIIKKNTLPNDLVFHTDMSGSPFFVIQENTSDKKIDEVDIKEAIDATFIFSRAWKLGLATANVFYVKPDQVTKEANTGEFLPKGAFMIRGKTTYVQPDNDISIGVYQGLVMCGPTSAIIANCENPIKLKKGNGKASAVARSLKPLLGVENIDDIVSVLPTGGLDYVKPRKIVKKS